MALGDCQQPAPGRCMPKPTGSMWGPGTCLEWEAELRALRMASELLSATSCHLQGYPEWPALGTGPRSSGDAECLPCAPPSPHTRWQPAGWGPSGAVHAPPHVPHPCARGTLALNRPGPSRCPWGTLQEMPLRHFRDSGLEARHPEQPLPPKRGGLSSTSQGKGLD